MDSIRKVRIKHEDGSYSESIPIGANSDDIAMSTGGTLTDNIKDIEQKVNNIKVSNDNQTVSINNLITTTSEHTTALAGQQIINENQQRQIDTFQKALTQEKVYAFENVAEMKNSDKLLDGMYCVTKGYYSNNDGGNGEYLIRTKRTEDIEDNGSIHFLKNNLVAELIVEDYINVKNFGAKGNGLNDDTNSLQKAINKYNNIFIPNGNYIISNLDISGNKIIYGQTSSILKISGNINFIDGWMSNVSNITFKAIGNSREYLAKISNSYHTNFNRVVFSNSQGLELIGLLIDGNTTAYYISIRDGRFTEFTTALKLKDYANAILIDNNEFYGCDKNIIIDSCDGNRITNNTFQDFKISGIQLLHTSSSDGPTTANTIAHNYFEADISVKDTTFIGDIDFNNDNKCRYNFIYSNQWTYIKSQSHIVNSSTDNLILDQTNSEFNTPNVIPGFLSTKKNTNAEKVYTGPKFLGCMASFGDTDEDLKYYNHKKDNLGYYWSEIIDIARDGGIKIGNHPIFANMIYEYRGGFIKLGQDASTTENYAMTYDTNQKLIKMYSDSKWNYYQKCESGSSNNRPTWKPAGYVYFDTTLNRPIFSTGSNTWVDATGTII